ncbi:CDC45 family [Zychaea mexicana]|uniref:CDC45 family n=1 Tax=Zychaea mexicana TaxID=64656 RepID=UPI0022FE6BA2|nr:CDC45 family [Zychaea mexicana]KAI9488804.1 CDC45 family [Zychaea mexicana]
MVLITESHFSRAFENIKQDSVEGNCILFVASDVDAICACKILQSILKADLIQHKLVPVSGHNDLQKASRGLVADDPDLRTIIMINCGAPLEVFEMFGSRDDVRIYVIDSHRPFNLDSCLPESKNVFVFQDTSERSKLKEYMEAYEDVMVDEHENDSASDASDQEEDDNGRPRQRRRLAEGDGLSHAERRRKRQRQRRLLTEYYESGVYHANSTAGQAYALATQLARTNNDLLWLAIIGITSQYIFERIDTDKYLKYISVLNDDVARFNLILGEGATRTGDSSIQTEDDFRFMLFRHWSLQDSMYHSGYVASKLGLWKEFGRRRLLNMFAKMGFSIQQCEQVYTHMDMDLKTILRTKIETVAPLYGLTDICFPSFARTFGWKQRFSASDAVYSLVTLLETSPESAIRLGEDVLWNQDEDWDALEEATGDHGDGLASLRRRWWMRNFYTVYDSMDSAEGLERGVKLCMKVQRAVVRQSTAVLEKRAVRVIKNFRTVVMRDGPDLPLFQHPLTLSKLALFLTDAYREHGNRNLPFVIASYDEEHESFLVVATTGAPTFGDIRKNPFGMAFQKAAERTQARISFDSFETSVLQIHKNDLDLFIENLFVAA